MENLIHVHIYEPHKGSIFGKTSKNDKSQIHKYFCDKSAECDAFRKGQCINVHNVFGSKCPHGKKIVIEGFSQRAKKYSSQISEWKERYSDVLWKLKEAPKRITHVSGGWMMPYNYINMNESVPFHGKSGFMLNGSPFLSDSDFTKSAFVSIISFKPQAVFGGEITSYQKDIVPKFIKDLYDNYREKFDKVANKEALEVVESYDFVGRKAILITLKPDCEVVISKKTWWWDGEKISREDKSFAIFEPVSWLSCYASYTPDDKATVKITSNDQVNEHTLFAD